MLLIFGVNLLIALVAIGSLLGVALLAGWVFSKFDNGLLGLISVFGIFAIFLAGFVTICQYLDK